MQHHGVLSDLLEAGHPLAVRFTTDPVFRHRERGSDFASPLDCLTVRTTQRGDVISARKICLWGWGRWRKPAAFLIEDLRC